MGQSSKSKKEKRREQVNQMELKSELQAPLRQRFWARGGYRILQVGSYFFTLISGIILTLVLNPFFAQLFSRNEGVTVSYGVVPFGASPDCNFYTIGIHPTNNKDRIKQVTLHLQFPEEIESYDYGTDQSTQGLKPAIKDGFNFEPPCSVKSPIASDLPSNIQITKPGQSKQQILVVAQDLDPAASFMLVVGTRKAQNPKLSISGHATFSAWNVDLDAPLNFEPPN